MSKKISQKQIEANKRNAQKSTGPRTKEGKTKSAMNSIKYGIYSKKYLIKDESPEEFDNYRKSVLKCLKPNNFVLFDIANQIISNGWEYQRHSLLQSKILNTRSLRNEAELKENIKQKNITISWLDSPELEEKYEAIREYNKNAPDDLEEKQKYLADYKLDKALSALRAKKVDQQEIKKEDPEVIINHENNNKEYAEGLPDDLWNINSLYKVNVIAKRHYANYHRGIHSYFEIKNKFNNLIDI
jgi:hypothetical protein